jgi:hypothetical protein
LRYQVSHPFRTSVKIGSNVNIWREMEKK